MKKILFSLLVLVTAAHAQTSTLPPPAPRGINDFDVQWTLGLFKYKIYRLSLTDKDIADSPLWSESMDSPPLAPREAIKLAQARLDEITQPSAWNFAYLELQPIDHKGHWAYMITFRRNDPPDALEWDHHSPDVVPVLMNGYVPKPKPIFISPDLLPPNLHPKPRPPPDSPRLLRLRPNNE